MRSISIDELHEHTDQLIAEVQSGQTLTLVRGGKPVADVVPRQQLLEGEERQAALDRLMALLQKGIPLGGVPPTRDEMHER